MTKEAMTQAVVDVVQQPSGAASLGSGVMGVATSFAHGVTPFVPVLSLAAMLIFGIINVMTNRRRLKLMEEKHDDE